MSWAFQPLLPGGAQQQSGAVPGNLGYVKVWTGIAWVSKPVKYWSGSQWITKPVKYWDGTQWILSP